MKRYNMRDVTPYVTVHPDGEWVRYEDHVEAMKRIAGDGAQQAQKCPHCGTGDVELLRLCHNSACVAYACEESIYKGWETAAPAPAWPAALTDEVRNAIEQVEGALELCEPEDADAFQRVKAALLAASPADQMQRRDDYERAYRHGWINCAKWAHRIDLVADVDSPAYNKDRDEAMKLAMSATPPAAEGKK